MGLFLGARVYDYDSIYASDRWLDGGNNHSITPDVKIMTTPGHTSEDATLLVSNVTNISEKNPCVVAICHLWWYEGKDDDPASENMEQLRESRTNVATIADFIVPGHGVLFSID